MNRQELIQKLQSYQPSEHEALFVPRFIELLKSDRCFFRDHLNPGHVTASALLFNKTGDQILMNHHKSLKKWLAFGGHCDGDEDVLRVAIRETMEESCLTAFKPVTPDMISIDIHTIPANPNKNEAEHDHYDISFIMQMTDHQTPVISDESTVLKWMTIQEALNVVHNHNNMTHLIHKALRHINA